MFLKKRKCYEINFDFDNLKPVNSKRHRKILNTEKYCTDENVTYKII